MSSLDYFEKFDVPKGYVVADFMCLRCGVRVPRAGTVLHDNWHEAVYPEP
jgi:hypothetical protein